MRNPFKKSVKTPEMIQAEVTAAAALAATVPEGELPVFKNAQDVALYFAHYTEDKQITLPFPHGGSEKLTIPAPTKKDLRWAQKAFKKDADELADDLCTSSNNEQLWRVYFLLEQQKNIPAENKIIDINREIGEYADYTPLGYAARASNYEIACLLVSHGADVDKSAGSSRRDTPLLRAINYDHLKMVKLLISQGAKFYPDEFERISHPEIKEYLAQAVGHKLSPAAAQYGNLNKKQKAKTENAVIAWNKAGDDSVVKSVNLGGGMRLHTVFNFKAEHVLRYTESVNLKGQTIAVSAPSAAEDFQRIRNRAEIDEAFRMFASLDGDKSLRPSSNTAAPRRIQKKNL